MTETKWWDTHDNIVILAHWMADEGYAAQIVADMVEKPWNWGEEWEVAQAEAQEAAEDEAEAQS